MSNKAQKCSVIKLLLSVVLYLVSFNTNMIIANECDVEKEDSTKIKLSIYAGEKYYCMNKPVGVKIVFENISDEDVLIVDPKTCKSRLSFKIKNSRSEEIKLERVEGPIRDFAETRIKLIIIKPGTRIEFCYNDITSQYFNQLKCALNEEGSYFVNAEFIPYRFITKDGRKSYSMKIKSNEIEILVKKCKNS